MKKLPLSDFYLTFTYVQRPQINLSEVAAAEQWPTLSNDLVMKNPAPCRYRHMCPISTFYRLGTSIKIWPAVVLRRRYDCKTKHCLVPFFPFSLVTVFLRQTLVRNGFFAKISKTKLPHYRVLQLKKKGIIYVLSKTTFSNLEIY